MEITFDPAKNAANVALRGLSFERVADFDFETAIFAQDDRHERRGVGGAVDRPGIS